MTVEASAEPPISRVRMVKRAIKIAASALPASHIAWLMLHRAALALAGPVAAPSLTILSAEGEPIARRGAIIGEPVDVMQLPPHVGQAFVAIEDRRFFRHVGIDPWGIGRAMVRNRPLRTGPRGRLDDQPAARQDQLPQPRTHAARARRRRP